VGALARFGPNPAHQAAGRTAVIALYSEDLVADGEPIPTEHVPPQLARVAVTV
jgi:hypothetical protein